VSQSKCEKKSKGGCADRRRKTDTVRTFEQHHTNVELGKGGKKNRRRVRRQVKGNVDAEKEFTAQT